MAKYRKNNYRNKKRKSKKNKFLSFLFSLVLIGCVLFLGFVYVKGSNSYKKFEEEVNKYIDTLDIKQITSENINLNIDECNVLWTSSNEDIISNTGIVTRPTYLEGDKVVKLTATFVFEANGFIEELYLKVIKVEDIVKEFSIKVKALEPSDEDYVLEVLNNIDIPEQIYDNINLIDNCINENISLEWTSNNECLNNAGIITRPSEDTLVTLSLKVTCNEVSETKEFKVLVLANPPIIEEVNDSFDDLGESSRYGVLDQGLITYYNARVLKDPSFDEENVDITETNSADNYLRLRSKTDDMAYFESDMLYKIKTLSFEYKYDGSQISEGTKFDLYVYINNQYVLVDSSTCLHLDEFSELVYDLSMYENFKFKIVYESSFSECFVLIENLKLTRDISEEDLINSIMLVSNIKKSIVLPFTTIYGGSVRYSSSDESILTNTGILLSEVETSEVITLTATIQYLDMIVIETFDITIKGNEVLDSLEIHFIDLGLSGLSDCGESIYIKYNDIDILVDAGDDFESTNYAVSKEIKEYSNDLIIDYLIATHPDSDHIGNMASVFEEFQIKTFIKFNGSHNTKKYLNLKEAYEKENCEVLDIYDDIISKNNRFIYLSSDIFIEFLDTGYYLSDESNGKSIVFVLNVYETRVLFTGDADNQSSHANMENNYMDQVKDIDILKVVHHGTSQGTSMEFLNSVDPEIAIICNGNYLGNKHGHPHPDAINNLINYDSDMLIYAITGGGLNCEETSSGAFKGSTSLEESLIDRNGTIVLVIDNNTYSISSRLMGDDMIDIRETTYWKDYLNR